MLKPKGVFTTVEVNGNLLLQTMLNQISGKYKLIIGVVKPTVKDLTYLVQLIEKQILRVIIERSYSFTEIQQAHQHAQSGHKQGNIVVLPN